MSRRTRSFVVAAGVVAAGTLAGFLALAGAAAQPSRDAKTPAPAGQPELPPGWTAEDMQACAAAGTPGTQHEHLARQVGVWHGKTRMWMAPGTDPAEGECTWTVTSILDGRYTRSELAGELPGLGSFTGYGVTGFDNVAQQFVGSWIDNHSTGIMSGVGELSSDGRALTWRYTYNCPITRKPAVVREVHTSTGHDTMAFEMFTTDPRSRKEFQCMQVEFTRAK